MAKELHFYRWDCKDYLAESAPLTDAQDLYYRRLMDLCALRGGRIDLSDEAVCRAVRARSATQKRAALEVLRDFFQGVSGDHSHPLIDRALALHEASASGGKAKAERLREAKGNQPGKANAGEKSLEIKNGASTQQSLSTCQSVVSSHESVVMSQERPKDLKDSMSCSKRHDDVKAVIAHMNGAIGSRYKASTKAHADGISARLGEGHSVDDLIAVIDHKAREWGSDPKMAQYLRPATLFAPGKFGGYLLASRTSAAPAAYSATTARNIETLRDWMPPT